MRIELSGGDLHITDRPREIFRVEHGTVLVYILPLNDEGIPGRRFKIYEAEEGELIPALYWNDELVGQWRFGLVALERAELTEVSEEYSWDDTRLDFASKAGIRLFGADEFEEQMAERYDLNIVKEEGYIYATQLERANSYEQGLKIIYNFFQKDKGVSQKKQAVFEKNDGRIYDALSFLCSKIGISIIDYDLLRDACKRKYTIQDIARLSHFVTREIVLDEKWYRKDCGPILAYKRKGRAPIACIPKGNHSYVAFDPSDQSLTEITDEYMETLELKADMLYKPLPATKLNYKDLLLFGLKSVHVSDIVKFVVMSFIGAVIGLLVPMLNQQMYDTYIPLGDISGLVGISFLMISISIGNLTFTIVKNLSTFRATNSMKYALQNGIFNRLFNMPESFFRRFDSQDLAQRTMTLSAIFQMFADTFLRTVMTALFSLMYLWRMYGYVKILVLPAVVMVGALMAFVGYFGFQQTKYEEDKMEYEAKAASLLYQFINAISKLRISGVEDRALLEYLEPYGEARRIDKRKQRISIWANSIMGVSNLFFSMVMYFIMIRKNASISVGSFMAFNAAFGSFSSAMLEVVSSFLTVNQIIPAYKRCKPLLEELPEIEEDMILPGDLSGDIEINNVDFAYDPEIGNVLNGISLHIKSGEYVAIVGASGCGKSTLLKLLLGFEKPSKGKIFYDGKDIDSMDKRELRKKFGVVLQNGNLISGSIFDNITITAPGTTMKQVQQVVKDVGLESDIAAMPMGLHTVLSENCGTISGGQRQRILIARAIVSKPKLVFFDEATSALDNVTQNMVCESLERLKATKLVIAHRLSTVIGYDRIIVMDKGQIVEQGNYEELMAQKGLFYQLASRQIA